MLRTESSQGVDMDGYQQIAKIGEGTYGVVYRARDKTSNAMVALKKIRLEHEDEGLPSTAVREISILKTLKHENVVELKKVIAGDNKLNLVFEYVDCDLKKYMESSQLSQLQVKKIVQQMLLGLQYCHNQRVMHRDLKPQNVLVHRDDLRIKLADFGLARAYSYPAKQYTHQIITLWYRSPEILLGTQKYAPSVDLWSVGCIMYELAHKKCLFCGDSQIDQLFKIFQILGTPNQNLWKGISELKDYKSTFPRWSGSKLESLCTNLSEQGKDLLTKLLVYEPTSRLTASQALAHPYFTSNDSTNIYL